MTHLALAACLLVIAQEPAQEPTPSDGTVSEAEELYRAVLDHYRGSQALFLVGRKEVRGLNWNGEPAVFENGSFELRVERPHTGLYTFHGIDAQGEPRNFEVGRTERDAWTAYYDQRQVLRRKPYRVNLINFVECDPIDVWFNVDERKDLEAEISLLPAQTERPELRGLRIAWKLDWKLDAREIWVNSKLELVEASIDDDFDQHDAIDQHIVYLFERAEPLDEFDPEQFRFGPPARFQETERGLFKKPPSERAGTYHPSVRVGHEAPSPKLLHLDGSDLSLESLRGRVTLLVFWAPRIEMYRRELGRLQTLWDELSTRRDDLAVVCVAYKDQSKTIADAEQRSMTRFLWEKFGYTLTPALQEFGRASHAFDVVEYPTYILIGPDGRIVHRANEFQIESLPNAFGLRRGEPQDEADAAEFERREAARAFLRELVRDLETIRELKGRYPEALDELRAGDELLDPWGRELLYEREGANFDLRCLGADGERGGNGPDADLIARYL